MKRSTAALLALLAAGTLLTGCEGLAETSQTSTVTVRDAAELAPARVSEGTDEEAAKAAITELYDWIYSKDGGEVFYAYMYPEAAVKVLKDNGSYTERIQTYNTNNNSFVDDIKQKPEITEFTNAAPMTDEQIAAAEQYELTFGQELYSGLKAEDIHITAGYDMKMSIIDYNGREQEDYACMVKLENDGWKYVGFSASALVDAVNASQAQEEK